MIDSLGSVPPWALWLGAGLLLAITEVVVPGIYLIWIGGAALATGLLALALPIPAAVQFAAFTVAAVALVCLARALIDEEAIPSADPMLNDRGGRLLGTVVEVVEPIRGGHGRVRIGDGAWLATGPDLPAGTLARVVRMTGATVVVEAVEEGRG